MFFSICTPALVWRLSSSFPQLQWFSQSASGRVRHPVPKYIRTAKLTQPARAGFRMGFFLFEMSFLECIFPPNLEVAGPDGQRPDRGSAFPGAPARPGYSEPAESLTRARTAARRGEHWPEDEWARGPFSPDIWQAECSFLIGFLFKYLSNFLKFFSISF